MLILAIRTLCRNNFKFRQNRSPFIQVHKNPTVSVRNFQSNNTPEKPTSFVKRITKKLFGRYLLTTNTIGSGVLMVIGDAMAQEIEYQRGLTTKRCDFARIGRMFIVGAAQGPLHHYFYRWMDKIMPVVSMKTVLKKITLDQIIMAPLCLVIFFYSAGFLEGKNAVECGEEFRSKFLTIYMVDWLVWPFAQFYNFYYLHPKYRVMYVNVVTALYNVFLSYIKHEDAFVKDEERFIKEKQGVTNTTTL